MFKRLRRLLASATSPVPASPPKEASGFDQVIAAIATGGILSKNQAYKTVRSSWSANKKVRLLTYLVRELHIKHARNSWYDGGSKSTSRKILDALMREPLLDTTEAVITVGNLFLDHHLSNRYYLLDWPVKSLVKQLETRYESRTPEPGVVPLLEHPQATRHSLPVAQGPGVPAAATTCLYLLCWYALGKPRGVNIPPLSGKRAGGKAQHRG